MNPAIEMHRDLYERSLRHQSEHGEGCTVFPSPQAHLWSMIATGISATRVLEIGCGIGYQTACIATAAPGCVVETIENDSLHADMAAEEFARLGLSDRITILRTDAESVLANLDALARNGDGDPPQHDSLAAGTLAERVEHARVILVGREHLVAGLKVQAELADLQALRGVACKGDLVGGDVPVTRQLLADTLAARLEDLPQRDGGRR